MLKTSPLLWVLSPLLVEQRNWNLDSSQNQMCVLSVKSQSCICISCSICFSFQLCRLTGWGFIFSHGLCKSTDVVLSCCKTGNNCLCTPGQNGYFTRSKVTLPRRDSWLEGTTVWWKTLHNFVVNLNNILSVKCSKHTGQKLYFLWCFALSSTA